MKIQLSSRHCILKHDGTLQCHKDKICSNTTKMGVVGRTSSPLLFSLCLCSRFQPRAQLPNIRIFPTPSFFDPIFAKPFFTGDPIISLCSQPSNFGDVSPMHRSSTRRILNRICTDQAVHHWMMGIRPRCTSDLFQLRKPPHIRKPPLWGTSRRKGGGGLS